MKIGARSKLRGRVVDVVEGATTAHVRIDIGAGRIVNPAITDEAVGELGLASGGDVTAIIKASDVIAAVG